MNNQAVVIFVYNADSGLFNTVTDIAHKIFSPSTYACQLCNLTHSYFSMREQWQQFLTQLDIDMVFLHKDEFQHKYGDSDIPLPVVLLETEAKPEVLMSKAEIERCSTLEQLMNGLSLKLKATPSERNIDN